MKTAAAAPLAPARPAAARPAAARRLALALALGGLAAAAGACRPRPPAYAPVKRRLCASCDVSKLPFNVPRRGVALGFGRHGSTRASWIVADLDRGALNRLTTWFDIQSNTTSLMTRREEPLGAERQRRLVELANLVWSADVAVAEERGTGVVWDLYLFDGRDVRHDMGGGRPGGAAAELQALLEAAAPDR